MVNEIATFHVRNSRPRSIQVVLEPWGREHELEPGAEVLVRHYLGEPAVDVDVTDESVTIWVQRSGSLEFADDEDPDT